MNFIQRLKYFLIGFGISLGFIIFLFGDRVMSCSYFPNDRVLAEIKIRPIVFDETSENFLKENNINKSYILDTILVKGKINFEESKAQEEPCPKYKLEYENFTVCFTKCRESTSITNINKQ